jgi:hypothetical protein
MPSNLKDWPGVWQQEIALDGVDVRTVASANVVGGIPVVHIVPIANAASGDTNVTLMHKTRVTGARVVLTATGNAGNTYTIKNAGNAITDAITPGATDTTVSDAATIDDAHHEIAAGGTLRVSHVRAGGSAAAVCYVYGVRVA